MPSSKAIDIAGIRRRPSTSSSYDPSTSLRLSDQNSYTVYEYKTSRKAGSAFMSSYGSSSSMTGSSGQHYRQSRSYGHSFTALDDAPRDWAEEAYEAMMRNPTSHAIRSQDQEHQGKAFEEEDEDDVRPILISNQSQGWIWNTDVFIPKFHQRSFQPIHIGSAKSTDLSRRNSSVKNDRRQQSTSIHSRRLLDVGKRIARSYPSHHHTDLDPDNGHDQGYIEDDMIGSQDHSVECTEIFISDD